MLRGSESKVAFIGRRRFYLGCFLLHFFLLVNVSVRDTFWVLAQGYTFLPHSFEKYWEDGEAVAAAALGQRLANSNPVRRILSTYLHIAGIEKGYGFFAPSVPNSYKLVFELHYRDGRIEYELPRVSGDAAGARFVTLLDHIGQTQYDPLREVMLKMLAYSAWQEHPDVTTIRAVFGYVREPPAAQANRGKSESYHVLYAYDFHFTPEPANSEWR